MVPLYPEAIAVLDQLVADGHLTYSEDGYIQPTGPKYEYLTRLQIDENDRIPWFAILIPEHPPELTPEEIAWAMGIARKLDSKEEQIEDGDENSLLKS